MASNATLWPAMTSAATLPSCVALCASMGWPTMSPMAKMCGTLVRICLSTGMKPRSSTVTPARFGADGLAVGAAADGDQHAVEHLRSSACPSPSKVAWMPSVLRLHAGDLGVEQDLLVALFHALGERPDQVAVAAGDELVGQFDHGDLGAQRVVDRGHLQADDAAADDQQALRDVRQCERAGGIHDPRVVVAGSRQFDGLRSRPR